MKTKPDCYKCKHRGRCAGSAHSCCKHPSTGGVGDSPAAQAMSILASVGRIAPMQANCKLNVEGHPTGVRRGWFNWPWNFDPHWLQSCDGFEEQGG